MNIPQDGREGSGIIVNPGTSIFRRLEVISAFDITPSMRRVILGGQEAEGFNFYRRGLGPYVKLLVPPENTTQPDWPQWQPDGRILGPPAERRPAIRTYTVRDFDPVSQEIAIDFVLHGDEGIASHWAARAEPGHGIGLMERGFIEPYGIDWYLFAGDHTALPAIAQSLENLPAESCGQAFISVPTAADRLDLKKPDGMQVTWLIADPHDVVDLPLVRAVEAIEPPADAYIYVWVGAEATSARALRNHVRTRLKLAKDQYNILNYWRVGHREGEVGRED